MPGHEPWWVLLGCINARPPSIIWAILTRQSLGKFLFLLFIFFFLLSFRLLPISPFNSLLPWPNLGSALLLFYFIFELNFKPQLGEFLSKAFWTCISLKLIFVICTFFRENNTMLTHFVMRHSIFGEQRFRQ